MSQSTPLRVLFLGKDAGRGGMQKELLSIVQFLDKNRFSPLVLLQGGGDLLSFYKEHAPTEVYSEQPRLKNKRNLPLRLQRWLPDGVLDRITPPDNDHWASEHARRFDPQIIVLQYMRPSAIYHALENSALPTLQTFLMTGAQTERLSNENLEWVARHPVVCTGRGVGKFLENCVGMEPTQVHEICTGLDLGLVEAQLKRSNRVQRRDLGIAEDDILIATCGNIVFLKGVDIWVEAAAILRDRFPTRRFKFMWVGGPKWQMDARYGQGIRKMIARYGLENHIVLTGDQQEIYPYLDLCDIYVQPSRDDAYPLATREGMTLSKPVVTFLQGVALEDYAKHALVIVPQVDPQALADSIAELMDNPGERQRLGAAGRQVIEDHLEITGSMRRYEELLLDLVRKQEPPH